MKVDLYKQSGEKAGELELPKEIFEVRFNKDLVHQALVRQLASQRHNIAQAKVRGEVRGGGRKPFKQKGTGRARQGSIRAPQMKGGAVIFGPRSVRNFEKDMPKKQRRKALFCAISEKARNNEIIALESYTSEKPKTKALAEMLTKLQIGRNVLILISEKNEMLQKSCKNIPNAKTILAGYINIADLQKFNKILILKDAVKKMQELFLGTSEK